MPPYSPIAIANSLISIAQKHGKRVTQMQLQKLVYIAHGWYLAINGKPLINSQVQAWQYGPVIPELYQATKMYGTAPIEGLIGVSSYSLFPEHDVSRLRVPDTDTDTWQLLEVIWERYGELSAAQLSALTHQEGTPWSYTWNELEGSKINGTDIPRDKIEEHFLALSRQRAN
jgi:uncharacterized phage-associated protein